jgi:glucose/arabinose dehydrogenase
MIKAHIRQWIQRAMRIILIVGLVGLGWSTSTVIQIGQAAPVQWPALTLQLITNGVPLPVSITHADDGSGRLYFVEQAGTIRIMQNQLLRATPFLDIHTLISCCGERGLLGLAFPPGYASKSHFYVYYTNTNGDIVIARYNTSADRNLADPASGMVVLTIAHPTFANHNGGQLAFGPDGFLYAGVGDGGSGGDPNNHGQSLNTLLAKILRLNVEGSGCVQNPPKAQNYCIPPNNPFVGVNGAQPEIWALGLRNPWRFSFDRQTGDLYIGDVGQALVEEIDFQATGSPGGQNYGWNILEGNQCYSPPSGCVAPPGYVAPITTYNHGTNNVNGCAIMGGDVYRGPDIFRDMHGVYFYADYCLGKIYGLKNNGGWQSQLLKTAPFSISTFGEDENGFIYVADYAGGAIYQLQGVVNFAALPFRKYFPLIHQ